MTATEHPTREAGDRWQLREVQDLSAGDVVYDSVVGAIWLVRPLGNSCVVRIVDFVVPPAAASDAEEGLIVFRYVCIDNPAHNDWASYAPGDTLMLWH